MKKLCGWCKTDLTENSAINIDEAVISHGICTDCAGTHFGSNDDDLVLFLESLDVPVLVLEPEPRVLSGNTKARSLLGHNIGSINKHRIGSLISCTHATKPGGCGNQEACGVCNIRNTLLDTAQTGRSHSNIPEIREVNNRGTQELLHIEFSTEKVGSYLLLRIDSLTSLPAG